MVVMMFYKHMPDKILTLFSAFQGSFSQVTQNMDSPVNLAMTKYWASYMHSKERAGSPDHMGVTAQGVERHGEILTMNRGVERQEAYCVARTLQQGLLGAVVGSLRYKVTTCTLNPRF